MNGTIEWIAASGGQEIVPEVPVSRRRRRGVVSVENLPAHGFPGKSSAENIQPLERLRSDALPEAAIRASQAGEQESQNRHAIDVEAEERERELRIYRGRTVTMLRRYMRYSMETGRMPSILGREFFRAKVTAYTVVTFEDRVIFVHDMERCLDKLDEFSRQLLARHILQEHDLWATARLLHCNEKTVRRLTPIALDVLSEILLDVGLLERLDSTRQNSCQGGEEGKMSVSRCEDSDNKF